MLMYNPPHPGEVIKELCLEPLGLSVTAAAKALGVSRKTLSAVINGHAGVSPEMAIRLSIAFNTSAESWVNQQAQYELWQAEQNRDNLEVEKLMTEQKVFYKHHQFFGCELLDISSSSIRRRIQEGKSIEYLTPPAVVKEIKLSKLYQNND